MKTNLGTVLSFYKYKNIKEEDFIEVLKNSVNKKSYTRPIGSPEIYLKIPIKNKYKDGDLYSISLYNNFFIVEIYDRYWGVVKYGILYENISKVELNKGESDTLTQTKISTVTLRKKTHKEEQIKYYIKIQYKNQLSEYFGTENIGAAKSLYDTIKNKIAQENKDDINEIRLKKLKKLHDANLISEEDYNKRKEEILKEI